MSGIDDTTNLNSVVLVDRSERDAQLLGQGPDDVGFDSADLELVTEVGSIAGSRDATTVTLESSLKENRAPRRVAWFQDTCSWLAGVFGLNQTSVVEAMQRIEVMAYNEFGQDMIQKRRPVPTFAQYEAIRGAGYLALVYLMPYPMGDHTHGGDGYQAWIDWLYDREDPKQGESLGLPTTPQSNDVPVPGAPKPHRRLGTMYPDVRARLVRASTLPTNDFTGDEVRAVQATAGHTPHKLTLARRLDVSRIVRDGDPSGGSGSILAKVVYVPDPDIDPDIVSVPVEACVLPSGELHVSGYRSMASASQLSYYLDEKPKTYTVRVYRECAGSKLWLGVAGISVIGSADCVQRALVLESQMNAGDAF